MTRLFAIATADPTLLRCELSRARDLVALDGEGLVLGLGAWDDGQLVQRRYGVSVTRTDMWDIPDCEAALYAAGPPPVGRPLEEVAQPFRWRQWLFAQSGVVPGEGATRERLVEQLPDYLQRLLRGPSVEEAGFVTFLSELRSLGRMDDADLEAPLAAQLLARTAAHVEKASGDAHRVPLAMVATNGRIVIATARGPQPLFYRLLEGDGACARCELTGDEKATTSLVRDHRRRRSVLIANEPLKHDGWLPVPEGRALAVSRGLQLQVV
ncbi:MAG: class II glutamine amidotransferase [Myxococcaceae bacterium]|nr:class II glutamine amidotransferase [Myxococcaceae bacterium]